MGRGSEQAASLTSKLGTPLGGELRPTLFQARVVLQTQSHTRDSGYFLIVSSLCFVICLKLFLIHETNPQVVSLSAWHDDGVLDASVCHAGSSQQQWHWGIK